MNIQNWKKRMWRRKRKVVNENLRMKMKIIEIMTSRKINR